jgi:outer membrane protein assembly factor BamD
MIKSFIILLRVVNFVLKVKIMKKSSSFFLIILLCLSVFSCSSSRPVGKTEAEVLFREAETLFSEKRFLLALERINLLRSQHPYSFYAVSAELMQADILYSQDSFIEAASAYLTFKDFHPKHESVEYVDYRIGAAYYYQLPSTFDRDLSPAKDAIVYFQSYLDRYPQGKYAAEVSSLLENARSLLRKKELYIAEFYFKTKKFFSARLRFRQLISDYGSLDQPLLLSAMGQLVDLAKKLEDPALCQKDLELLSTYSDEAFKTFRDRLSETCSQMPNKEI